MSDLILRSVTVAHPGHKYNNQKCDIGLLDGKLSFIERCGTSHTSYDDLEEISCEGKYLCPSFVDAYYKQGEPGMEPLEDLSSSIKMAQNSGFGHLCVAHVDPISIKNNADISYICHNNQSDQVNLHPIGSALNSIIKNIAPTEMLTMAEQGAIAFRHTEMDSLSIGDFLRLQQYAHMAERPLLSHPFEASLSNHGVVHDSIFALEMGLSGVISKSESIALSNRLSICEYFDLPYFAHLISSGSAVSLIKESKSKGQNVRASVSIINLLFNFEAISDYNSQFKVWPVLRSDADRLALISGVFDGTIDLVVSNHHPVRYENKMKEFEFADFGALGLEVLFPSLLEILQKSKMDRLIKLLSIEPRRIFSLPEVQFDVGEEADYCLFDPDLTWTYDRSSSQSKSENNPYYGRRLTGKALALFKSKEIYWNDSTKL